MKSGYKCEMKWEELTGEGDLRRHCEVCNREVINLIGKTEAEARALVEQRNGEVVCARYVWRDGRVVHDGDPIEQLRAQRRGAKQLVAAALIIPIIVAVGVHLLDDSDDSDVPQSYSEESDANGRVVVGLMF